MVYIAPNLRPRKFGAIQCVCVLVCLCVYVGACVCAHACIGVCARARRCVHVCVRIIQKLVASITTTQG